MLETPKTRRVSKLPTAEVRSRIACSSLRGTVHVLCQCNTVDAVCLPLQRKHALDICCRCVEGAYQDREGPSLQHASHFRAFGYKVLKKALCLKGARYVSSTG